LGGQAAPLTFGFTKESERSGLFASRGECGSTHGELHAAQDGRVPSGNA
jgi:hypothetical protein